MKVQFHAVEEFLAEITKDADRVEGRILRVTVLRRFHDPFVHIFLLATTVVGGVIVRLDHRLGECFAMDATATAEVGKKAEALVARLDRAARELGLEVRAGVVE